MKTALKKTLAVCVVLILVLGISACKNSSDVTSSGVEMVNSGEDMGLSNEDVLDNTSNSNTSNSIKNPSSSGDKTGKESGTDKSTVNSISAVPSKLKGTTVTLYNWNAMNTVPGAKNAFEKFTKETGIKTKWITGGYDTYASELAAMVSAGNAPDVMLLKCRDVSLLKNMQPLTTACKYDFKDKEWDKQVMSYYTVKGKVYATSYEGTLMQRPCMMIYNKALISQYGLKDPYALYKQGKWTMDAFVEICLDFVDKAGSGYWAWSPFDGEDMMNKRGVSYTTFDGSKYVCNISNPKVLAAFKEHAKYTEMGITTGSFYQGTAWNNGKILFFTNSAITARKSSTNEMQKKGILGIVPMPRDTSLDVQYQVMHEYEAYGVPKGAKNAESVPYLLNYYLNPANYDEKNFFYDATVLSMYKECMANPNKFVAMENKTVLTKAFGLVRDEMTNVLVNTKADQLESKFETYRPRIENAVALVNNELAKVE